jgi:cytochrome bd ubiquinol oxidase subunit II
MPFYAVAAIFMSAFGTLAISFWPYMIPFVITIDDAAAPHSSLAFMFWGAGLFVFPLMLIYTIVSYRVFRLIFDSPNLQTIDRKNESALEKRRGTTLRR